MKQKADGLGTTQQTFVVSATFVTYKTVKACSVTQALQMAEDTLVEEGATSKNLSNWHAHPVE